MIKKAITVFLLALMAQLIVACVNCDCPPVRTIYYTDKGISLKNMDLSLPQPMLANSGTVAWANYGVRVELTTEWLALKRQGINWALMQAAYACSCPEDNFIAKETILSLKIFSDEDFDPTHPKNTDLSLYFKAKRGATTISIADYIKLSNELDYTRYAFYEGIFLQIAPKNGKKHKFKLILNLSDGRTLEAETTQVELT